MPARNAWAERSHSSAPGWPAIDCTETAGPANRFRNTARASSLQPAEGGRVKPSIRSDPSAPTPAMWSTPSTTDDFAEGDVAIGRRLPRQSEQALAHDVALHLVGAAGDRDGSGVQPGPPDLSVRRGVPDDAVGPGHADGDLGPPQRVEGQAELEERSPVALEGARAHPDRHPVVGVV